MSHADRLLAAKQSPSFNCDSDEKTSAGDQHSNPTTLLEIVEHINLIRAAMQALPGFPPEVHSILSCCSVISQPKSLQFCPVVLSLIYAFIFYRCKIL